MPVSSFRIVFLFFFLLQSHFPKECTGLGSTSYNHHARNVRRQVSTPSQGEMPDPLLCDGVRNRKEFRDLSRSELTQWRRAILNLTRQVDDEGFSEWDRLVILHASFVAEAHGGSYFLPWHRFFLLLLENALRRIQPGLALPYWDWGHDAADPAISPVWRRNVAGRAVQGGPIGSGAFRNLTARFPERHMVERGFNSGISGAIPPIHSTVLLDLLINLDDYGEFSDALEVCHNIVHSDIGGDMGFTALSPNDPVFFLHHAFVDYVWYQRQRVKGIDDFGGTHSFGFFRFEAVPDWELFAFNRPVSDAFNISCVNYVEPSFKNSAPVGGDVNPSEVPNPCNGPNIASGLAMDTQRCMEGESVLGNLTR